MNKTEINFMLAIGLMFFVLLGAYGYTLWLIYKLLKGRES